MIFVEAIWETFKIQTKTRKKENDSLKKLDRMKKNLMINKIFKSR